MRKRPLLSSRREESKRRRAPVSDQARQAHAKRPSFDPHFDPRRYSEMHPACSGIAPSVNAHAP